MSRTRLCAWLSQIFSSPRSAPSKIPLIAKSHPFNIPDLPFTGIPLDTFHPVTPAEVLKFINKSSYKSSSIDNIPTSLIKSCFTVFSESISNLANLSISQGSFPFKFKLAKVTPLLKKPGIDKNTSSNYRPISNLSNISKLLERLIQYYHASNTIQHLLAISTLSYPHIGAIISLNRLCCWPWTISTMLLTRAHRRCW